MPLLQLHSPIPRTDGQGVLHFSPTITKTCKFICRNVDMSRMTCLDKRDNMCKRLRGEKKNSLPSVVDGRLVVVLTSFIDVIRVKDSLPMTSVAFPEEKASCHAIFLLDFQR
jgi:hypothetical protein